MLGGIAFVVQAPNNKKITTALGVNQFTKVLFNNAQGNRFTRDKFEIFPTYDTLEKIEAGGTVRTYKLPLWANRLQYRFESNGRPLRGQANLWIGPLRSVHTLKFDTENGIEYPIQGLLKFKTGPPVLKLSTTEDQNYPMKVGVFVPPPDRASLLEANTETIWKSCTSDQKQLIQGGGTNGKQGMRVNWTVPHDVKSVQIVGWSIDSGRKSFKLDIELLQGPNNIKQSFFLQCGGGSQPYHIVLQTPGPGWTVRMRNKKFMEDGLIQVAVLPYEIDESIDMDQAAMNWN